MKTDVHLWWYLAVHEVSLLNTGGDPNIIWGHIYVMQMPGKQVKNTNAIPIFNISFFTWL